MPVQPRPSAAVMLLRDTPVGVEVFMVRRSSKSAFMPDVYVFPGGSVTAQDRQIELETGLCAPIGSSDADPEARTSLGSGFRVAALRELFEEANILLAYTSTQTILAVDKHSLARFSGHRQAFHEQQGSLATLLESEQLMLATDQLHYFSHWITPEASPKRFDAHFFLAQAPQQQEAIYDQLETSDGVWIQASVALKKQASGSFELSFPTLHQLRELAAFTDVATALLAADQQSVQTHRPIIVKQEEETQIILPE